MNLALGRAFARAEYFPCLDSPIEAIMNLRLRQVYRLLPRICLSGLTATAAIALLISPLSSQTTATGALAGELLDPSGAVIPGATLRLFDQSTTRTLTAIYTDSGRLN